MSVAHLVGMVITLLAITATGVWSGRQIKDARDFAIGGGKAGAHMVAGSIIGTLVGGSSTIATAQLAFRYGFSALWFNLGGGLGCLALALFFVRPMRRNGCLTIQQMIAKEYGARAGIFSAVLGSLGIFLNVIAQLMSAMALLSAIVPSAAPVLCAAISCLLMACYVLFGGMQGAGIIGIIKTLLLYGCVVAGIGIVLFSRGGIAALWSALPHEQYFNLFARGLGVDGGAALSLILGVLSTQTYAQSILSGKSDLAAVKGALASAVLIPPIGLGGVLIGLYMRNYFPAMDPSQAFPQFVLRYMPGFFGGVALAALLIAIVGCGAGLALGIGSIFTNNLYPLLAKKPSEQKKLAVNRGTILVTLLLAAIFTFGGLQSFILQWSFMSMGLRGAVVFLPMCGALFLPGKIHHRAAVSAIVLGPMTILLGKLFLPSAADPLFFGIGSALVCMIVGYILQHRHKTH